MQVSKKQAWRWLRALLGLFLFSAFFFRWDSLRGGPTELSLPFLLILFYTLFILWAYLDLGIAGAAVFTGMVSVLIFAHSYQQENFMLNEALLVVGAVFGIEYALFSRNRSNAMVRTAELEHIEGESRLLRIEHAHQLTIKSSLRNKFNRYATLKEVTEIFASPLSEEQGAQILAKRALEIIEMAESCIIFLVDQSSHRLGLVHHLEREKPIPVRSKEGNLFDRWVLKQRKPLLVSDITTDFRFRLDDLAVEERKFRSVMVCPLMGKRSVGGVVRVHARSPEVFKQDDLRLLDILSSLGSASIENTRLYRRTKELAIRDSLTSLYVHRYFMERYAAEHQRALAGKTDLTLLMCDLDYFKQYNDRYGHAAGDRALKHVAHLISEEMAPGEIAARYGGEEFVLLLPGVTKEEGLRHAERLRTRIETSLLSIRREETQVTLSIGVSHFPSDALDRELLIRKADEALYKAKREGRNCVCLS